MDRLRSAIADGRAPSLVGRTAELAQIDAAFARAREGRRVVVVIQGPMGCGRSRLLREVADAQLGCGVISIQQGPMPRGYLRLLLRDLERQAARRAYDPTGLVVLAWDDPGPVAGDLMAAAVGPDRPLVVVATHRTGGDRPYLAGQPADSVTIDLEPLPDTAVTALLTDLLGAAPDAELSRFAEAAAGQPGAVVELVEGLRENGSLRIRDGLARLTRAELPPASLRRIRRQLTEASAQTRHVVQVAAALGTTFRLIDLVEQFRDTPANLLPAVEQALHMGLFRPAPTGLAFSHNLVHAAVVATVPAVVLEALGDRPLPPPEPVPDPDKWDSLSSIEKDIAHYVRRGLSNREIGPRVFLSPHTVNYHLRQIFRKLGISSRVQLAALADRHEPDLARR